MSVTLMVSVVTAVSVLLRVNYDTWLDYRSDSLRNDAAVGVLRHIVREVRQCEEVTLISGPGVPLGTLAVRMPNGNVVVWEHIGINVHYGISAADQLLGDGITGLRFVGYERDGITPATLPQDVQCVQVTVDFSLPSRATSSRTLTSKVWIRAF
ncbi:hypothetical protein C5Y93_29730 [Blastopirellula marina]|uniref:Prepilin-type cleavage/methylation domain-containing protein n=1 Tax=Blastopirellula marina TaxID=124 RepID=A0A2S8GDH3_9BACT|nr:hypothetical protein C5Y93_29730 [Blastopirellula marina]